MRFSLSTKLRKSKMKFYCKIGTYEGKKAIVGCTDDKKYAQDNWPLGSYVAVYCDSSHKVRYECERQGFTE